MIWIFIILYIVTIFVAYGIICYHDEWCVEPGVDFMLSVFWPVTLFIMAIAVPFETINKFARKLKENKNKEKLTLSINNKN